jgi:hypothetical protein
LKRPDIFASKESSHHQTNKVAILATISLPRGKYSNFKVFRAYLMGPQLKILEELFSIIS